MHPAREMCERVPKHSASVLAVLSCASSANLLDSTQKILERKGGNFGGILRKSKSRKLLIKIIKSDFERTRFLGAQILNRKP